MKKLFTPFQEISKTKERFILTSWLIMLISFWVVCSAGETHMFPTPKQVLQGFVNIWNDGLMNHLQSSVSLCLIAILYSTIISLLIVYISNLPFIKPLGKWVSMLRYLPLTGISFYITILVDDARTIQVWVLVMFMSTFLTTSLLQMVKDIPEEEFQHAKTLGCNRWEILWEILIKGRFDYVLELIRQNLAIVWMMLVSIESILVAAGGLGVLIKNHDRLGKNGDVIATQILIIIIGLGLDYILTRTRKLLFRYSSF